MLVFRRSRLVDGSAYDCKCSDTLFTLHVDSATGKIAAIYPEGETPADPATAVVRDMAGATLCTGLIDVQMNGAFGVDFADPQLRTEDVDTVLRGLLAHGVTAVCPTIISSPPATYAAALPVIRQMMRAQHETSGLTTCRIIGAHLEGPYLAEARKGAHAASRLQVPGGVSGRDPSRLADVLELYGLDGSDAASGLVRIVTLAPELPGGLAAITALQQGGVVAAIGHTTADLDLAAAACSRGASLVTHLYNAMPSFGHRAPGPVGLLGGADALRTASAAAVNRASVPAVVSPTGCVSSAYGTLPFCDSPVPRPWPATPPFWSIIADGVHVHPAAIGACSSRTFQS